MIKIAHRGNTNGPNHVLENSPNYIDLALEKGFDVEIDVWLVNEKLFTGHDEAQYNINIEWLSDRESKLWIHCKNKEALTFFNTLGQQFHYFWHDKDVATLTSRGYIWAYPGCQPFQNSIAVMPEIFKDDISQCLGICSDYLK